MTDLMLSPALYKRVKNKINFGIVYVNISSLYNFKTGEVIIGEDGVYFMAYVITGIDGNATVSLISNYQIVSIIKRSIKNNGDKINDN